ncbi:MAG: tRNA uridine-5-carboxymethylaminomethyl(34) synthesis GTPase MnmE [Rickettsiales bacterium]|jgi:tRNA modification GTPase|nr:tRNA uridine-5-carboxymethylaminomethyl(34) synthesis GTPase MnmE [Rickettsiales bacterium]
MRFGTPAFIYSLFIILYSLKVMSASDTIFALSSGAGKAGVAVIRVSGPDAQLAAGDGLEPRVATLRNFYNIDNLVAVWFPAPKSFTGEDVLELYCHGGQAVVAAIFDRLRGFGFRMAERGEFARRAFDNGKMDLVEIDSMRALIDARTEKQRARALSAMTGADSEVYMKWRDDMVRLSALAAARMDYPSDDLPADIDAQIAGGIEKLSMAIGAALASPAHKIESGFSVVLAGPVNAGKSSLFNAILGSARAIVSDIPGTTRDVVSAELDIGGFLVRLSDTAGLRESEDEIEKIGIGRARDAMADADVVLQVCEKISNEQCATRNGIVVVNKCDLVKHHPAAFGGTPPKEGNTCIRVSAKTGEGVKELVDLIRARIEKIAADAEGDLVIGERARGALSQAVAELKTAGTAGPDLQAEHIAAAADEIGRILGIIGSDEIYDSVFGQLCLGK